MNGFFYRRVVSSEGQAPEVWKYWLVCVPIVVIGAPLGAFVGRKMHRLTLARAVYVADSIQLAGALFVIRPWLGRAHGGKVDNPLVLSLSSIFIFIVFGLLFRFLSALGLARITDLEASKGKQKKVQKKVRRRGGRQNSSLSTSCDIKLLKS